MKLCIFQPDPTDSTVFICTVCGKPWKDRHGYGKSPNRNCKSENIMPNLKTRISNYLDSREQWITAGKPIRSQERINEIFNTYCSKCPHYTSYCCDICGCFINKGTLFNKIAWSTTRCPDIEPKWIEELEFQTNTTPTTITEIVPVATGGIVAPSPPKSNGCGCGNKR